MAEAGATASGTDALRQLQFPPPGLRAFPTPPAQLAIFLALAIGGVTVGLVVISRLLDASPVDGPGGSLGFAVFGGTICFLMAVLALIVLRVRHFQVHDGVMTLVMPRRAASGKRIRHVALQDIVSAEPIVEPKYDPGIWLILRDGSRFPIFEGELPRGGGAFLDVLAATVNRHPTTRSAGVHDRQVP